MSVHVSSWAWKQIVGDAGAKLVLLKLADQANDKGECWPSQRTLARECEMSLATVKRKLDLLYGLGLVHAEQRRRDDGGKSSLMYRVGAARPIAQAEPPHSSDRATPIAQAELSPSSRVSYQEPSIEPQPTADAVGGRARDLLWDKLADVFGVVADKTQAHGKRNKAVGDLRKLGATPSTIDDALAAWPQLFDGAAVTDVALATHYPQLIATVTSKQQRRARSKPCDECGTGGGLHAAGCSKAAAA